jgi:RNA polymerase sigma factor (sigma-70 family)
MRAKSEPRGQAAGASSSCIGVEDLFRREYDAMHRLAYTMLGADDDAQEAVQEAFLGVAARWDELDNPGGYLRVSVVNGSRKRMRSQNRRTRAETMMNVDLAAGPVAQDDYLLDVLDDLPDRQRVAVVLTYYSALNSNEVGKLMDCQPATVRSLVRHALDQLRKVVDQ